MAKNKQKENNEKKQSENKKNENERKVKMYGSIISIVISGISLLVSFIALGCSIYYANKEYEYKLSPEITTLTGIKVEAYQVDGNVEHNVYANEIQIQILNKNNLEKAYLIYPNNVVKKLNINEVEGTLEEGLNEDIKMGNYDFESGGKLYQYRFLYLMGLDGSYDLYLIYAKTDGEEIIFNGVSGVEIWGLANSNLDNPEYEGERLMAEQYRKILEESSDYIK